MHKTGFTTTIPLEVVLAAGHVPVDLNNVFITDTAPDVLVEEAELEGFPRNICSWIKGIYSAARRTGISRLIAVTEGDCSNTRALMEVLSLQGVVTIPFAYPGSRDRGALEREIAALMEAFAVDVGAVAAAKERLDRIRRKVWEIDRMTWEEDRVTGGENHYYQVCTSDMNGDPDRFEKEVDLFLAEARARRPDPRPLRLAFVGVPPIISDLYEFVERQGARVVFNETQRQFTMPGNHPDLVSQYLAYTYPYDIFHRLDDIERELRRRRVDAVIHYVQSFCFRQIEDMVLRRRLSLPILTLEGDKPGPLDARSRIRIEGFLELMGTER